MDESPVTRLPITQDALAIRRVNWGDLNDLAEYWGDPDVARFQFWEPMSMEQVREAIAAQAEIQPGDPGVGLMLVTEFNGKVVADFHLTITTVEGTHAEVGFSLNPRFMGQGIATRSLALVLGFGFVQLGLHRISAATGVRNDRAWKLMDRVGTTVVRAVDVVRSLATVEAVGVGSCRSAGGVRGIMAVRTVRIAMQPATD